MRAWRASVNWPENNKASSSLFCLKESTNHKLWVQRSAGVQQKQIQENASLPFNWFATNCVPFVPQFTQHVVQLLIIILQRGLVFQGTSCSSCGVIHWVFAAQRFLELLWMREYRKVSTIWQQSRVVDCFKSQGYSEPSQRIFFLLLSACQAAS